MIDIFNSDIDLIIAKDACTQTSNSSWNYVITEIFHNFSKEYFEFKKHNSDFLTNLNSKRSEQTNNHDIKTGDSINRKTGDSINRRKQRSEK